MWPASAADACSRRWDKRRGDTAELFFDDIQLKQTDVLGSRFICCRCDRGQIDAYGAPPSCRGIVASNDALPPIQQCVFAVRPPWPKGEFLTPFIDSGEDLNMTIDVELNLLASGND